MSWTWWLKNFLWKKSFSQDSHFSIEKVTTFLALDLSLDQNWKNWKLLGSESFISVLMSLKHFETSRKHASEPGIPLICLDLGHGREKWSNLLVKLAKIETFWVWNYEKAGICSFQPRVMKYVSNYSEKSSQLCKVMKSCTLTGEKARRGSELHVLSQIWHHRGPNLEVSKGWFLYVCTFLTQTFCKFMPTYSWARIFIEMSWFVWHEREKMKNVCPICLNEGDPGMTFWKT